MMQTPIYDVAALLPHSGKMVLLDEIAAYDEQSLTAYACVKPQQILVTDGYLPSWAAMEIMAQGVAAWAGAIAHDAGEPVRLGFLLGTRKLQLYFSTLPVPAVLQIKIQASLQDTNGFGVFDSQLWLCDENKEPDQLLAEAALNVYSPTENILTHDDE
ncbi:ApeP family dehydratase [Snodgrassella alvi]|jgi:predicted hotdog family 3-hydroxylacyl-ACP dehydratase|nr:thioester dehydrase [Snodgrassella alvi]